MVELDYLVVGHMTRDLLNGDFTIGGTACYAARTAQALGCRVGIVTSAGADVDFSPTLDGILVSCSPAAETTTFENVYTAEGRRQVLHAVAKTLVPEMVPVHWRVARTGGIVHVGPVAQECDPALVGAFGDAFVGVTPQGWMRHWDQAGRVSSCPWRGAEPVLARADAIVLSEEDVAGMDSLLPQYASRARLLVVTRGAEGCIVYGRGRARRFPAPAVCGVDATGAGDVFAAAFFVWLRRSGDPWTSARFANCVAARSVTRMGLASTPRPEEVLRCRRSSPSQARAALGRE